MQGGFKAYARNENRNVIMFDLTFGTNRHGMKLGFFATVGYNGETIILACVILISTRRMGFLAGTCSPYV
ncbi:hypothetical protein KFE25_007357 [Diacronema lutheri]|uniref:Uncharacterized protein n=1 Tax=Diacronema lutheri TaxID=2081491 RepID=A0A8J5XR34_DIALT|nr:hypothetical protein KFE25_011405 [Diacronema lutheri]KAG8464928.1 hypothetical protein KFE25_012291 [Diacronema lutheri]KAG8468839.1 hypothetical protein KFE25_007357 [Diacronema lutheri]